MIKLEEYFLEPKILFKIVKKIFKDYFFRILFSSKMMISYYPTFRYLNYESVLNEFEDLKACFFMIVTLIIKAILQIKNRKF